MSRIGQKPVAIPKNVKVAVGAGRVTIEGPKGKSELSIPPRVRVTLKESDVLVERSGNSKADRALHGTARALLQTMVTGVSEGYVKELEIQGVGFRAQAQGKNLTMALGFSHPVEYKIPEGIVIETPKPTQIFVKGVDKQKVGEVAAEIRGYLPPEPYKGKGIRYAGEYVRKKAGKAVG